MTEDKNITDAQNNAYYSALYNAWIESRMERDKSLIMLSSGGIGLIVTLINLKGTNYEFIFSVFSVLSFLITIVFCLEVYRLNSDYLEKVIHDKDKESNKLGNKLKVLDQQILCYFVLGIIFAILFRFSPLMLTDEKFNLPVNVHINLEEPSTTLSNLIFREIKEVILMTEDKKKIISGPINDSLEGISKLKPENKQSSSDTTSQIKSKDEKKK